MMTNNLFEARTAANGIPFLYFKKATELKKRALDNVTVVVLVV